MLKKFYKILMLFSLLFLSIPAYANVGPSKIPVTYNISEDRTYNLNIKVSGDGTVYDGTKSIRNGKIIHQLKVSKKKVLKIIPDKGASLKSISWKNGDIDLSKYYEIENIKEGKKLYLKGVSTDSELEIKFYSKDNTDGNFEKDPNDSDIKEEGEKSPQTGDKGMLRWIILLILSLTMILIYGITYKRNQK